MNPNAGAQPRLEAGGDTAPGSETALAVMTWYFSARDRISLPHAFYDMGCLGMGAELPVMKVASRFGEYALLLGAAGARDYSL